MSLGELLDQLDAGTADRFLLGVMGLEDYHFPSDCKYTVVDNNGVTRHFKEYNYLEDRVKYTYEKDETRYYPDNESANKWGYNYSHSEDDGHKVVIIKTVTITDWCSLSSWKTLSNK